MLGFPMCASVGAVDTRRSGDAAQVAFDVEGADGGHVELHRHPDEYVQSVLLGTAWPGVVTVVRALH